jgi:hypothetical protein
MNMDYGVEAGPSSRPFAQSSPGSHQHSSDYPNRPMIDDNFDIAGWYTHYQNCQQYFLDTAQHSDQCQILATFLNIRLPYQKQPSVVSYKALSSPSSGLGMGMDRGMPSYRTGLGSFGPMSSNSDSGSEPGTVSLTPYIRRMVATGFDEAPIFLGFFGNNWKAGVGTIHEIERRNYLFAAKSGSWLDVKSEYDMGTDETVPFLKPLSNVAEAEIAAADKRWSDWIAMQDWMLGPRAPEAAERKASGRQSPKIKTEPRE